MPRLQPDTSHIVCSDGQQGDQSCNARCLHCGAAWRPSEMPIRVEKFAREIRAFIRAHRDCPKPSETQACMGNLRSSLEEGGEA